MLPWVDDFLPVHNLASLEALAKALSGAGSAGAEPDPGRRYLAAFQPAARRRGGRRTSA
jgi:hypothetical protein